MDTAMADAGTERIAAVRHFNRFYTRRIGVLHEGLLDEPVLAGRGPRALRARAPARRHRARPRAVTWGSTRGYLSRILQGFARRKLVSRGTSAADARQRPLTLTPEGRRTFAPLDRRSHEEVAAMLAPLADSEQDRLAGAMQTIERLLEPGAAGAAVRAAHAPAGRHGLGDPGARRALLARIRMGRALRGAGRAHCRRVHRQVRSAARAMLDRGARRRAGRLGVPGAQVGER